MTSSASNPRPAESHFNSAVERAARVALLLFPEVALLLLTGSPAFAQAGAGKPTQPQKISPQAPQSFTRAASAIRKPAVRAQLNPNLVRENRRPEISFVPFDMVDPYTGKAVAPGTMITFPNGKRTTAQQYYSQLNQIEQWLTQRGYSLRLPHNGVAIHEIVSDKERMRQQLLKVPTARPAAPSMESLLTFRSAAVLRNEPIRIDAPRVLAAHPLLRLDQNHLQIAASKINAGAFKGSMLNGVLVNQVPLVNICARLPEICNIVVHPPTPCNTLHNVKPWGWDYGDPSTFHAYLNGQLALDGEACKPADMNHVDKNNSHFQLSATGKAGGTIFGIGGDILNVNGAVNVSGATSTAGLNFSVNVLGQTVYNFSNSQNAEWSKQDTISQPIDFGGATISVPIVGPISLDVTIGASGNVGLNYGIYLNPTFVSGNIEPFANANVYAQAGVGVPGVAEAGVGVNLTLVNFDLQLGAKAGLVWFGDFILQDEVYGYINLNLLAGQLYAYAKIGHPCFDWPPWCVDQYNANIWSEPGLTFDYTLFDQKNDINLHWLTSAPPSASPGAP